MATAVFGRKKHMTQAFQDDGTLVSVTVIEVEPNLITAVRTAVTDGYEAVQVGFGAAKSSRVTKAHAGTFAKLDAPPRRHLKELRGVTGEVGETIGADVFEVGDKVHVSATSKARASRDHQAPRLRRGPVAHGSHNIRQPGSVGAWPTRPGSSRAEDAGPDGQQGRHGQEPRGRRRGRGEQRALGARRRARRQERRRQDPEGG